LTDEKDPGTAPAPAQVGAGGPAAPENQQAGPPKPAAGWMPPPPAGAAPAEIPSAQAAPDRGAPPAQDAQAPPGLPETADAVAEAEMAAAPAPPPAVTETDKPTVIVRYGAMGLLGRLICTMSPWRCGQRVVIKSERGQEIGTLVCAWGGCGSPSGVPPQIRGEVLRAVTHADEVEARHLAESERREFAFSKECVAKRALPMKMVAVEHLFGGDRIIFHFVSESRVDFRALVRDLAHEFQTRIEMRQIGVRDEARLLGDYERCGRPLCCRAWIKELEPVSMKMAKIQKATLDPTKISGRCGRLMCCLRFEHATYRDLARTLPRKNTLVVTAQGPGKVIDVDVISQRVGVLLGTGTRINVPVESLRSGAAAGDPVAQATAAPEALPEEEAAIEMVADSEKVSGTLSRRVPDTFSDPASPAGPLPPNGGAPEAVAEATLTAPPVPPALPAPAVAPVSPAAPGGQPGQGGQRQGRQPGPGGPQQGEHRHRRGRRRSRRGGRNRGRPGGPGDAPGSPGAPPAQPPQGGRDPSGPAPSQGN
jgi:cell fate regulator YaaT (PSP1 superfamily)